MEKLGGEGRQTVRTEGLPILLPPAHLSSRSIPLLPQKAIGDTRFFYTFFFCCSLDLT